MNNGGFVLLWNRILRSSIWDEDTATRVVWITILALKDENGMVVSTFDSLRRSANVTEEECRRAVEKFEAPEPGGSQVEGGKRIIKVEGGWTVVNHEKYRYSSEERRQYWRERKAKQRQRLNKPLKMKPKADIPDMDRQVREFEAGTREAHQLGNRD